MTKFWIFFMLVLLGVSSEAAGVTNVLVRQRWPWSQKVDIDFTVIGSDKVDVDLAATWKGQATPVALTLANGLAGRSCGLLPGEEGHVSWDPTAAGYTLPLEDFRVTATPVAVTARTYLVIDLTDGSSEYCASEPAGGWSADDTYRTTKMVFRRIPAGAFTQGMTDAQKNAAKSRNPDNKKYWFNFVGLRKVTLSDDYYIAIYRVTQAQYQWIKNGKQTSTGDAACYPQNREYTKTKSNGEGTYFKYRGDTNEANGVAWPYTQYRVTSGSVFGKFRMLTGQRFAIDFPTEAQWENAVRGGKTTIFGHCDTDPATAEEWTNVVKQVCGSTIDQKVGLLSANSAYGLYDALGLGNEQCLDQWNDDSYGTSAVTDPVGAKNGWRYVYHVSKTYAHASCTSQLGYLPAGLRRPMSWLSSYDSSYGRVVCRPAIHLNSVFKGR